MLNPDEFAARQRLGTVDTQALRPLFADLADYRLAGTDASDSRDAIATRIDADFCRARGRRRRYGQTARRNIGVAIVRDKWTRHVSLDDIISFVIMRQGAISDNVEHYARSGLGHIIESIAQAHVSADRALRGGRVGTDDRIAGTMLWSQITSNRDGNEHNLHIGVGAAPYSRRARIAREPARVQHRARMTRPSPAHGERTFFSIGIAMLIATVFILGRSIVQRLTQVATAIRAIVRADMSKIAEVADSVAYGQFQPPRFDRRAPLNDRGRDGEWERAPDVLHSV